MLAILYRVRGRASSYTSTGEARLLYWTLPMLLLNTYVALLYGLSPWVGAVSGIMTFIGISIGHGFAQGQTPRQYLEMGFVCYTRLAMILLPFYLVSILNFKLQLVFWYVLPLHFFLCWGAAALSYSSFFNDKHLTIAGIDLCVPYVGGVRDSSWQELLIGGCYDIVYLTLILNALGGGFIG